MNNRESLLYGDNIKHTGYLIIKSPYRTTGGSQSVKSTNGQVITTRLLEPQMLVWVWKTISNKMKNQTKKHKKK